MGFGGDNYSFNDYFRLHELIRVVLVGSKQPSGGSESL